MGHYNSEAKLHVVQWANESSPLVFYVFRGHDMVRKCPRCKPWQIRCDDPGCEQCVGTAMDLAGSHTTYVPSNVAIFVLHLLPIKKEKQNAVYGPIGKVLPTDVDFDAFSTHTGIDLNYIFSTF